MTERQFDFLFSKANVLMNETKDANHNWDHIERVIENIEKIRLELPQKIQEIMDDKVLKLAAAWHDISYAFFESGFVQFFQESKRSVKIFNDFLKEAKIAKSEADLMKDVVRTHTGSQFGLLNRGRSFYHQLVQDADTIEVFFRERLERAIKLAEEGNVFWKFAVEIYKPLTYNWYLKHYNFMYNLPGIVKKLEAENKIAIYHGK